MSGRHIASLVLVVAAFAPVAAHASDDAQVPETVSETPSPEAAVSANTSRSPVSAEDLYGLTVSVDDLSATERNLIGTWQGRLPDGRGPIGRVTISLNADGTYRLSGSLTVARNSVEPAGPDDLWDPGEVVNLGRWSASRGLYTTVITRAGDGKQLNLSKAAFTAVYAIRSISDESFVFQSIATGDTYTFERLPTTSAGK